MTLTATNPRAVYRIFAGAMLALLIASGPASVVSAQTGTGGDAIFTELEALENRHGLTPGAGKPVVNRLLDIERRVFGVEQYGPIIPRLERLRKTTAGQAQPAPGYPSPPPASQITPPATQTPAPLSPSQNTPPASQSPPPSQIMPIIPAQPAAGSGAAGGDAFALANAFPPGLVRIPSAYPEFSQSPDYYSEVRKASKGKTIRFKSMPIPVYIQPFPDRDFVNCVIRSFENWEHKTKGAVRFQQVDNSEQARIRVVWKHLGGKADAKGCLLGAQTILKYTDRGSGNLSFVGVGAVPVPVYVPRFGPKYKVPPQVMEVNLDLIMTKDYSIRYRCLQNIVTHELGHALGLLGHSTCQADIMFPITDEHSRLSDRDLNTLIKLYGEKADIPL